MTSPHTGTFVDLLHPRHGGRTAVVIPETNLRVTYEDLRDQIKAVASALAAAGARRGDRIGIALPNGLPMLVSLRAATMAGTAAPFNPQYREDEFRFYFDDASVRFLILPPTGGLEARRAAGDGVCLLNVKTDANGRVRVSGACGRRAIDCASEQDVALLLHTSGGTGTPKRVPLSHANLTTSANNVALTYALRRDDVSRCVMPLVHVHGLVASTLATLATGGVVVLPSQFNALSFWQTAREARRDVVLGRARHASTAAQARGRPLAAPAGRAQSSLCAIVHRTPAAGCDARPRAVPGRPCRMEAYGMTEAAHQIASNSHGHVRKPGSAGPAMHVRRATADDCGRHLPNGTSGEVVIQGPNVIRGYDGPHAPTDGFVDVWFRTGDIGYLDQDDRVMLGGRIKELINRGGEKVAPRQIDEVLLSHPAVTEAVCFGMPHEIWGEEIGAAVVLSGDVAGRELLAFCRARIAEHKSPKGIFVMDTIPRSATGKVLRRDVARHFCGGVSHGLQYTAKGTASILAGWGAAFIVETTGSWLPVFWTAALFDLIAAALVVFGLKRVVASRIVAPTLAPHTRPVVS